MCGCVHRAFSSLVFGWLEGTYRQDDKALSFALKGRRTASTQGFGPFNVQKSSQATVQSFSASTCRLVAEDTSAYTGISSNGHTVGDSAL